MKKEKGFNGEKDGLMKRKRRIFNKEREKKGLTERETREKTEI